MTGWLIFIGYLVIMTITWRVGFALSVDRGWERERDLATLAAALPAILWPLTLVIAPVAWFVMRPTPGQRRQERERELREREREVERLERKYGL